MSTPLRYYKPLSLADRVIIDTVTAKYEGIGESWVAFDRGDHIELKCPDRIRRVFREEDIKAEAPALHGISNGTGGSNGDSN